MTITKKQLNVISYIEENLGIIFEGTNKEEARKFISKYINESRQKKPQTPLESLDEQRKVNQWNNKEHEYDRQELIKTIIPQSNEFLNDEDDDFRPW